MCAVHTVVFQGLKIDRTFARSIARLIDRYQSLDRLAALSFSCFIAWSLHRSIDFQFVRLTLSNASLYFRIRSPLLVLSFPALSKTNKNEVIIQIVQIQ